MSDPFACPGCHDGDFPDFDHFVDAMGVTEDELGVAFAAWLAGVSEWDGEVLKIERP